MLNLSLYDLKKILERMILENYSQIDIDFISRIIRKKEILLEDTSATGGAVSNATVSGMGTVVPAAPSSLPGALQGAAWASGGGNVGSGDISIPYNPSGGNRIFQKMPFGLKGKKSNLKKLKNSISKLSHNTKEKTMNFNDFVKKGLDVVTKIKESNNIDSVESICLKYHIENWKLNTDGTVDVDGNVNLVGKGLTELPLKFGKVTGWFHCNYNNLTSLEGCPTWVGGNFWCSSNKLTSLVGSPSFVDGDFCCMWNKLTNLEGCPEKVLGNLFCISNKIHSLEYYPPILTGKLFTEGNPIHEIWENVWFNISNNISNNHGVLLELFWLNNPIRYENGEWVCYREFLDNFFEEIGVPTPPKLENYKEV